MVGPPPPPPPVPTPAHLHQWAWPRPAMIQACSCYHLAPEKPEGDMFCSISTGSCRHIHRGVRNHVVNRVCGTILSRHSQAHNGDQTAPSHTSGAVFPIRYICLFGTTGHRSCSADPDPKRCF